MSFTSLEELNQVNMSFVYLINDLKSCLSLGDVIKGLNK